MNEGFTHDTAASLAAGEAEAVAFGTLFIPNPELPRRFRERAPLNPVRPEVFCAPGAAGDTDSPSP